jgi:hypothetical protein
MYQLIYSAEAQTMLASRRQELRNQTKERFHPAAKGGKPVTTDARVSNYYLRKAANEQQEITYQEGLARRIGE